MIPSLALGNAGITPHARDDHLARFTITGRKTFVLVAIWQRRRDSWTSSEPAQCCTHQLRTRRSFSPDKPHVAAAALIEIGNQLSNAFIFSIPRCQLDFSRTIALEGRPSDRHVVTRKFVQSKRKAWRVFWGPTPVQKCIRRKTPTARLESGCIDRRIVDDWRLPWCTQAYLGEK